MIHLVKKGEKFHVVEVSPNHEVIKQSQPKGLSTRKGAIKNIRASAMNYTAPEHDYVVTVQDNTGTEVKMLLVTPTNIFPASTKPGKKYVLGARKSPGKKATRKKV